VDEIEARGFPSQVRIMAHSASITKSMQQTKKSRAWENATLKTAAQDIANEHGLELVYNIDWDPKFKRLDQTEQADLEFLHRECNKWDFALKVAENKLIIVSPEILESQPGALKIDKDEISGYFIRQKSQDIYRSCRTHYHDPKKKKLHKSEIVDSDILAEGDRLDINDRCESQEHAERRARKELRRRNKYEVEAEFTMMGRPDLVAGIPVSVEGFGQWDGDHFIEESRHDYSQGSGYVTSVRTRKGKSLNASG
jgi:phage protein D